MRSIKFDQLGRKAPVPPPVVVAPSAKLAASPLELRDEPRRDAAGTELPRPPSGAEADAAASAGSKKA